MYLFQYNDNFDYYLNVLPLNCPSYYKRKFFKRIRFIDNYQQFNDKNWDFFPAFIFVGMKFNNKIFKFKIEYTISSERGAIERYDRRLYAKADIFLIFYDAYKEEGLDFEYDLSFIKAKEIYKSAYNQNKNAIFCLIRDNYRENYNLRSKLIISDEEALEFADKNNLLFSHISINEKYECGLNQLFYNILKELYLQYPHILQSNSKSVKEILKKNQNNNFTLK